MPRKNGQGRSAKATGQRLGQAEIVHGGDVVIRSGRREAAEDDARDAARGRRQFRSDGTHRYARGAIGWKAINTGRYGRKGKRRQPMSGGEIKRCAVAGGQQFLLAFAAAAPNRADSVDHVLGRQPVAAGDFGAAGLAAAKRPAFGQ